MADRINKFMAQSIQSVDGKWRLIVTITALWCLVPSLAWAQSSGASIRLSVQDSGVYVFNTLRLSIGQGFNIYRSDNNGDFVKLNERPVEGAQNISEFLGQIGPYAQTLQQLLELESTAAVYMRLRSSRLAANLATFYYSDVARALGHLYVDTTATMGTKVTYRIEVVDDTGQPSGRQIEKEAVLKKTVAPQPSNLKAEHTRRQVTLTWNYPTSTVNTDDKIIRFNIYDRQNGRLRKINKAPIIRINNFEEFTQTFNVPRIGVTLQLVVMPVDIAMQEGPASEVLTYTVADKEPPAIITGLQAVATQNGEVELTWPVSTEVDAAGYNLFRAQRIKGTYKKLNGQPIALLDNLYIDRPAKQKTTYFYRISAIDSAGNESERSNAAKADVEDHTPPKAPLSFSATPLEGGGVQLSWEPAEQESGFKSYVLLRKQMTRYAGKADAQLNTENLLGNSFIDKGEAGISLAEGARYRYQIFAEDSARNFSDTLTAFVKIPDVTPPEAPTRLLVENDNGVRAILRWNASRSLDVGEYVVYRGLDVNSMSPYRKVSVKNRNMRDDSVLKAQTYFYAVSAVDTLGNEGDLTEATSFFMKDFTPPRAVRNVRATKQNGEFIITWEPVNAPDLKGYRVYTSQSPSGVYSIITDRLIDNTEFKTKDLDADSWIQVRALDTSGNESNPSKPAFIYIPESSGN
jgi:fibronectin type 3 domain-containing protein